MAWSSSRFVVGIVLVVAAGCDRPLAAKPSAPTPVSATATTPSDASGPGTESEADVEANDEAPPEPACEPTATLEPVETWSASGPPPQPAGEELCTALEQRARRAIEGLSGPCESAEDCELVRVACPFGCTRVFSRHADRRRARVAFDRYVDECPICKDKCPKLPVALACEDGVCVASAELPASACTEPLSGP